MMVETHNKIQIRDNVIVACTGSVGFAQRLMCHVEAALRGKVFKNLDWREGSANIPHRFIPDLQKTFVQNHPQHGLRFGALMAAAFKDQPYLIEYSTTDFQPESKEEPTFYVTMGSGQSLADPFVAFVARVLWKSKMPTVDIGKLGVYWVLDHTIKHAPGLVGLPIHMATLRKLEDAWVAEELQDTSEAAQYVRELEKHIGDFAMGGIEAAESEAPPEPPEEKTAKDEQA